MPEIAVTPADTDAPGASVPQGPTPNATATMTPTP